MGLKELLKRFEGEKLKPYRDTANPPKWTIGVGFNFDDNPLPEDIQNYLITHGEITQEMSDRLLDASIIEAEINLASIFTNQIEGMTSERWKALVSIMFNIGIGRFKGFKKMIAAIKAGDWDKAADELLDSARTKQVGERAHIESEMLRNG
jgi:lysozyme